jgi:hypothetical protein
MRTNQGSIGRALGWAFLVVVSALGAMFFAYYTMRLVYINVVLALPPAQRESGMYIGAVVFPVASCVFGYVSWLCASRVRRTVRILRSPEKRSGS